MKFGVGQPIRRVEDLRLLTGKGRCQEDQTQSADVVRVREVASCTRSDQIYRYGGGGVRAWCGGGVHWHRLCERRRGDVESSDAAEETRRLANVRAAASGACGGSRALCGPGNMRRSDDVRAQLTRLVRGWCGYFSPGSHYVTDRAIEAHIITASVTSSSDATRCLREASGCSRWRQCSARSVCHDCAIADDKASCLEPNMKPVGKPDAGNPHVRFDERGGETGCESGTAPFLDSAVKACFLFWLPSQPIPSSA